MVIVLLFPKAPAKGFSQRTAAKINFLNHAHVISHILYIANIIYITHINYLHHVIHTGVLTKEFYTRVLTQGSQELFYGSCYTEVNF